MTVHTLPESQWGHALVEALKGARSGDTIVARDQNQAHYIRTQIDTPDHAGKQVNVEVLSVSEHRPV